MNRAVAVILSAAFHAVDLREVLVLYERLTATRVFIALDLQARVTVAIDQPVLAPVAIELIRNSLLQRYGIELRASGEGETLAAWSTDPRYPRRSESPPRSAAHDAAPPR